MPGGVVVDFAPIGASVGLLSSEFVGKCGHAAHDTDGQRTCPSCGTELSGGFCPVCMLRKGLSGATDSGASSVSEDTVEHTPEQPAQRFATTSW